jgi:hypothetical protein
MDDEELPPEKKHCPECKLLLPDTSRYFSHKVGCSIARQSICKKCRKALARKSQMNKIEAKAIDVFVTRSVSGGINIPHTAELLEAIMANFGGVQGFAAIAMKQYWDAAPGSRIRSGVLEMVTKLASQNTEHGGARKPISLYSEDELESEIEARINNVLLLKQSGRCIDVKPESPAQLHVELPSPLDPADVQLPAGRAAEIAGGIGRSADGVPSLVSAHPEAVGVPSGPGQ